MVQNKLSILDMPIQPQMKKSYKKFIKSLSNEEIKSFCLNQATKNFVDYLPRWIKFWNHVPLIGYIYRKSKQSLLDNINSKLSSIPESYGLIPGLNKTQTKINSLTNEVKITTKERNNYRQENSGQEKETI